MGEYMGSCSTTEAAHTDKMGKGQNEGEGGGFSEDQIQMYKDCFKLMDINKAVPWTRMTSVELLTTLVSSCPNLNLMTSWERLEAPAMSGMINMFQEKMAGDGNDPDELILQAFMAYDLGGKIDVKMFQHALRTWGDKMSNAEIDDIFEQFDVDEDYMVKTKEVVGL